MRRILLPLALLGFAAACDSPDAGPPVAAPSPAAAVVDCGTFDRKQREGFPAEGSSCLIEANKARKPAFLKVTMPSTEGDPIITTYHSGVDGKVEVISDTRQDNFGPKQVTRETCDTPTPLKNWVELHNCSSPMPVAVPAPSGSPARRVS
ncbi:DUF4362 domain-containing protein [Actinoplanes sp. NBRC 103695]|uniref:DUF4362 domain-containing protein n=1 Tax=Actinoplanes sp. NBRC 103695 TaxID=3032202 RepID=UPI0024A09368|nr:DUF4362 domain-containing protein [Actinoplanes sp. NBRC 103695]GLY93410.1 hypothetical protein Acsp02_06660 [Actinoplanes sp. NBRC 103695]